MRLSWAHMPLSTQGLNPYSTGRYSVRSWWGGGSAPRSTRLNPYSTGRYSVRFDEDKLVARVTVGS